MTNSLVQKPKARAGLHTPAGRRGLCCSCQQEPEAWTPRQQPQWHPRARHPEGQARCHASWILSAQAEVGAKALARPALWPPPSGTWDQVGGQGPPHSSAGRRALAGINFVLGLPGMEPLASLEVQRLQLPHPGSVPQHVLPSPQV